jgi:uncharacterized protein
VTTEVLHAPERHRFEVHVDGALAGFAAYVERGDAFVFTHTEIADEYEGRGLGSVLARDALDTVRAANGRVVPLCPFIAGWIERHPDYADLVDADLTDELRRR